MQSYFTIDTFIELAKMSVSPKYSSETMLWFYLYFWKVIFEDRVIKDKDSYKYTTLYRGQLFYRYNNVLDIAVF